MLNLFARLWLPLTLFIVGLITYLSLTPLDELPKVSGTDKLHHFIAYATLALPIAYARPRFWFIFILGFVGYSGLIEIIQPYVNRHGEWLDLLANSCGLTLGTLIAAAIRYVKIPDQPKLSS
ncbi:VanZ family protein [Vibrio viridaestus]|uniref:VanZ family protein n=1 Tax=Vibrio viridaestus TaxID=2487322 RepID=A0A3N9TGH2_9VIBR|nr:VanZ family protein [Vibrio viridaestus]RQW62575.1 VanZ family protein [Vibrio viridaestus]